MSKEEKVIYEPRTKAIIYFIVISLGFIVLYSYSIPFFVPPIFLEFIYATALTIINIFAITLSFMYFDWTKKYEDEVNPIAKDMYNYWGHKKVHIVFTIMRIILVVIVIILTLHVFSFTEYYISYGTYHMETINILISVPLGIFTAEMIYNLKAISTVKKIVAFVW